MLICALGDFPASRAAGVSARIFHVTFGARERIFNSLVVGTVLVESVGSFFCLRLVREDLVARSNLYAHKIFSKHRSEEPYQRDIHCV